MHTGSGNVVSVLCDTSCLCRSISGTCGQFLTDGDYLSFVKIGSRMMINKFVDHHTGTYFNKT